MRRSFAIGRLIGCKSSPFRSTARVRLPAFINRKHRSRFRRNGGGVSILFATKFE